MKKYTTFNYQGRRTSLLTASIIGFEEPDRRMVFTNVILESGGTVPLNGMSFEDAKRVYEEALEKDKAAETVPGGGE